MSSNPLGLKKTSLRSLKSGSTARPGSRIGNVAICSGCHGCTHVGAVNPLTDVAKSRVLTGTMTR
ncbi:MAG: hypothetical protein PVH31_10715 [Ectothiorhodospiraceae bacterium]|jgi:hypothetical protein